MRVVLFILILLVNQQLGSFFMTNDLLDNDWQDFIRAHSKEYSNHIEHDNHELRRRLIWESNLDKIHSHNSRNHHYKLKMNKFGDLTHDEFVVRNGFIPTFTNESIYMDNERKKRLSSSIPSSVDWRTNGYVTGVKDQGQCGLEFC